MKVANPLTLVAFSAICLVAKAETKPYWLYIAERVTDEAKGYTAGYLTDGHWKLTAQWKYGGVAFGQGAWQAEDSKSYCWIEGEGVLDMSKPIYEVASLTDDPKTAGTRRYMYEYPRGVWLNDTHVTTFISSPVAREFYGLAFGNCLSLTNIVLASSEALKNFVLNGGYSFEGCTNLVSLAVDCPEWTSIPNGFSFANYSKLATVKMNLPKVKEIPLSMFDSCTSLESLVLDMPALETITKWAFRNCPLRLTDMADLNIPNVKTIGTETFHASASVVNPGPSGVVRLPHLEEIWSWAFGRRARITGYELGSNSLKYVGVNAFCGATCEDFVLGNTADITFQSDERKTDAYPFRVADASQRFHLTGSVPSETALANLACAAGTVSKPYCSIFVSSRRDPGWKTAGGALTAAEQAESPCDVLGVVTDAANQRAAWLVDEALPGDKLAVKTELSAPGWSVQMEAVPAADADGLVEDGAQVTLTVVSENGAVGSFYRWYGDVGDGDRFSKTVTFTMKGRDVWAMPVIDRPWTYDAEASTISDGDWSIYVTHPATAADDELWLMKPGHLDADNVFGDAYATIGTGILNLNGPITDKSGKTWKIRRFGQPMPLTAGADVLKSAQSIVVPRTINYIEDKKYFNAGNRFTLRTLIFDLPEMTVPADDTRHDLVPFWLARGHRYLRNLIVRIPGVRRTSDECLADLRSVDVDVGDWSLPDVTRIGELAFRNDKRLRGMLTLPKLTQICTNAFENCAKLDGVVIGSPRRNQAASIGDKAFKGCGALKDVTITADPNLSVGADAFGGCTAIENLIFPYRAPSASALANILVDVKPATGDKACCVWGSTRVKDTTYATLADPTLTAAEEAAKPTELPDETEVLGVFRVAADGAGLGRAWVMNRPGQYDRRGLMIMVR